MKSAAVLLQSDSPAPGAVARQALAFASFGTAYFLLAVYAASLPVQVRFPLYIWPADGLALGVLLVAPARRWPVYLSLAFVASLYVTLEMVGLPPDRAAAAVLMNVLEPALIAVGLQRLGGARVQIDTLKGLGSFLIGMVPLVAAITVADAAVSMARYQTTFREQWSVTFVSDMLGMVLVAPLVLAWSHSGWHQAFAIARSRTGELVSMYAGLILAANYVFGTRHAAGFVAPLEYLCAPFLIWAALRFGLRAATLGLTIFGLLCYWHSAQGSGPFSIGGVADWRSLLRLQGYLATVSITTLFAAALLVERVVEGKATDAWRRRYDAVIRASDSLLYELDPASGTIVWDGDTRAVLGLAPEEIAHVRQWVARVHPDDRMKLKGLRARLMTGELGEVSTEYRVRKGDDTYTSVGVNGYSIEDPLQDRGGARRVIGFVADVSEKILAEEERARLEAQLKQAEKMEAVGRLAGGIAHDFNNILGAILGYGELAQTRAAADPTMKRYVDTIMNAGNRAKSLVTQILSYSRAEGSAKIAVVVSPIAAEVCDLLSGSTPGQIHVRFESRSEDATVLGDPTRFHQLLMNLATNAMQAMPDGGTLSITVEARDLGAALKLRAAEVPAGHYAVVTVGDTGHGIKPELIDRIFEPFFTTKPAGRGTGLGLALVHTIVQEHAGYIDVTSTVGKGTTFTVYLPLTTQAPEPEVSGEASRGRGEVVLAVDDETAVLEALEEMLAALGYEPVGYSSSRAALEAFEADPKRFDAVVSDEVMPGLTGTQLAVEVRKLRPGIPVVIATGFGGPGFEMRALAAGVNRVLRKPYRMSDIGDALTAVLPRS